MTPEEHADEILRKWEKEWYCTSQATLEDIIAAAIRVHEAEVREELAKKVRCGDCGKEFVWTWEGSDLWCPECLFGRREHDNRV